jgi:L-malate glycosyltransferase
MFGKGYSMRGEAQKSYAFVLPWSIEHPGGVNEVVKNLIEEFQTAGEYHPILIESHWASKKAVVIKRDDHTHIRVRLRHPFEYPNKIKTMLTFLLFFPSTLWSLAKLSKRLNIRAVNLHYPTLQGVYWIALQKFGLFSGKVILSFHGSDIRSALKLDSCSQTLYRYIMRQANAVVSCSEGLQSEVLLLEPNVKKKVIYNGIDLGRFANSAAVSALPIEACGKEIVLNIGCYEYRKGHDVLLRAFAEVIERRSGVHLIIVGASGPEIAKTKRLVQDLALSSHVTLLYDVPHSSVVGLLKSAKLFALSSRWEPGNFGEGFPLAILEAAAASKPVLTTNTCGAAEIIKDGVTGRLVPLENHEVLRKVMCELLEDGNHTLKMAENLNLIVQREFTWKAAYQLYRAAIE